MAFGYGFPESECHEIAMRYLEILRKESFYVIGCAISYFGPQAAVEMTLSIVSKCFALLRSDPHGRLWLDFTEKY